MKPYSKTCYYCGKKVYPGTGTYYYGRLVHLKCKYLQKARRKRSKKKIKVNFVFSLFLLDFF